MPDTNHDHPLQPRRPSVPPEQQPKSTQSHPAEAGDTEAGQAVGHERSDVNIRAIAMFVVGLFAVGLLVHVALFFLMGFYEKESVASDPAVSPLAAPAGILPPEPRLLINEPAALQQLHLEEDGLLKNIERAKSEVVGALPAREGATAPDSPGRAATMMDTSSGRKQ